MTDLLEKTTASKRSQMALTNFIASDFYSIKPQKAQEGFRDKVTPEIVKYIEDAQLSFTIINEENGIVSVLGVIPAGDMGVAWAVHSDLFKQYPIEISRTVREFFDDLERGGLFKRFITSVTTGFEEGERWVKFLKFKPKSLNPLGFTEYERIA